MQIASIVVTVVVELKSCIPLGEIYILICNHFSKNLMKNIGIESGVEQVLSKSGTTYFITLGFKIFYRSLMRNNFSQ